VYRVFFAPLKKFCVLQNHVKHRTIYRNY